MLDIKNKLEKGWNLNAHTRYVFTQEVLDKIVYNVYKVLINASYFLNLHIFSIMIK